MARAKAGDLVGPGLVTMYYIERHCSSQSSHAQVLKMQPDLLMSPMHIRPDLLMSPMKVREFWNGVSRGYAPSSSFVGLLHSLVE